MYNPELFKPEVSKPVQLLLLFVMLVPLISSGGVFPGNASDIVGGTGLTSELISFASNAGTIGMAIVLPVIFKIKFYFKVRPKLVAGFLLIAMLLIVTATTSNIWIIGISSLFMGFIRMLCLFEVIMIVQVMISPDGDKGRFYSIFYVIAICIGQIAGYYYTLMAYHYSWVAPHYFLAWYFIVLTFLVLLFCHNKYFTKKTPLYYNDWFSMFGLAIAYMLMNYGLVFLRQKGWMADTQPYLILIGGIIIFALMIYRQSLLKRPFLDLSGFKKPNVIISTILLAFVGLYLATGSLQSAFVSILGYDNVTSASLSVWSCIGIVIGGLIGVQSFKKNWNLKYYITLGFASYILYCIMMYFMISPVIMIEYLYIANVIKGMGMIILFIAVWYYGSVDLNMVQTFGVYSLLLVLRTFLGSAAWGALISYTQYTMQWQSINDLAIQLDSAIFYNNGVTKYSEIQIGALLSAIKQIFGYIIIIGFPICVYVLMHNFGSANMRRIALGKMLLSGKSIRGYKLRSVKN